MRNDSLRPIPGYESDYAATSTGEVYSYITGKYLSKRQGKKDWYTAVSLRGKQFDIHRLVALTYPELIKGVKTEASEINHIDGTKYNNDSSNLEWVTRKENLRHSVDILGKSPGPQKLTNESVAKIKQLLLSGQYTHKELSKIFSVSEAMIWKISANRAWKSTSPSVDNSLVL